MTTLLRLTPLRTFLYNRLFVDVAVEWTPAVLRRDYSNLGRDGLAGMTLNQIVKRLEAWAPRGLAESWDNVGLLVEPVTTKNKAVEKIMLTNDLTEAVLDECLSERADLIVSYHPPIFAPIKRLTTADWKVN